MIFKDMLNRVLAELDPEIWAVARIIKSSGLEDHVSQECDKVFQKRLQINPKALKMSFWENHFEWKSLRDYPEINGRILDFGCGSGHADIFLARKGYTIHGVDLSPVGIRIASYLRTRESRAVQDKLCFSCADVTRTLPETEPYDAIWSSHVFEHIADPGPVLNGLRRWVKPGAHMLVSVPYGKAYDDPAHVNHFYSSDELCNYLEGPVTVQRTDISTQFNVLRALCYFGAVDDSQPDKI
jgi:SAM-dependent methyltransferase